MRTIEELAKMNGHVYVRLNGKENVDKFMKQAEEEGFTFADGRKPTSREGAEIMAVNRDNTINFVGVAGAIAFGSGAKKIGDEDLIRVDFEKYMNGEEDFSVSL